MPHPKLILASTSKIRHAILKNAGIAFEFRPPEFDEALVKPLLKDLSPRDLANILAAQKALSLSGGDDFILGADQTLSCAGQLYNKPNTLNEAHEQLMALRGQTHYLHSALAIAQQGQVIWSVTEEAKLSMRNFSAEFARSYVADCGPTLLHTVGGYKLETVGVQLFEKIEGDYFTILGLPLLPCLAFLRHIKFIAA